MSEEEFVRDELFSDSASPADVSASTDAPEEAVLDAEATEDEAAPADVADDVVAGNGVAAAGETDQHVVHSGNGYSFRRLGR